MFKERLGDELYGEYVNSGMLAKALINLLGQSDSSWFDDPATSEVEDRAAVFVKSFREAVVYLEERVGSDPNRWTWGALHTLTIYHPFGRVIPALGRWFNIGPLQMDWGLFTTVPGYYSITDPFEMQGGSDYRFVMDFSGANNSLWVMATGNSGHFISPHYDDQTEMWHNLEYWPFLLNRDEVERGSRYILKMMPQ